MSDPESPFSWDFPTPPRRAPVLARNVIATSQPLAVQAGLETLRSGGNAVDAALAAAAVLTVVEPTGNGLGGDAFALVWDGGKLYGLNGSGRSPRAWNPARFQGLSEMPRRGWDAVTVPGQVAAWVDLSKRFGKLAFPELLRPAIHYAREGFPVSPVIARSWRIAEDLFRDFPAFSETFLLHGRAPIPGACFRNPDLAATLEEIAETEGESFYRGRLADCMTACAAKEGGALAAEDLASHRSDWVDPLGQDFGGIRLWEIPPNGQGIAALLALGILGQSGFGDLEPLTPDWYHLQIESMKRALAVAYRHVADPAHMTVSPDDLLDPRNLAGHAKALDRGRAGTPRGEVRPEGGTVNLSCADAAGMMVSFIQSNFYGFGSGVVIPGTGISMQSRGMGFSVAKGHPNRVDGGKRPYHTIIPAFVTCEGRPVMSFGLMGGNMQPQGHLQMICRIFGAGQNPQAASDAPRWYLHEDFRLALEENFPSSVAEELERRGHRLQRSAPAARFGGAQLVYRLDDGYFAASDHRKDGQAVGF
jgi:gamma-glutamyltranspeptidase/glutathione hydrolase